MKMKNKKSTNTKEPEKKQEILQGKRLRRKNIILAITIGVFIFGIVLGILLGFVLNRISILSNRIAYLSDTADIIMNDVSTLQSDIEATLEEETSLLESWDINLVNTDFRTKTYTVDVSIIPKEYTDSTKAIIYFGTNQYELTLDNYSYKARIKLHQGESYAGNVTVLFIDGDKKSTEVIKGYKDVQPDFSHVLSGNATEMPVYKDGKLQIDGAFDFALQGDENFKFESFELVVQSNQTKIDTVDLKELAEKERNKSDDTDKTNINDKNDTTDGNDDADDTDNADGADSADDSTKNDEESKSESTGKLTLADATEQSQRTERNNIDTETQTSEDTETDTVSTIDSLAGIYEMKGEYDIDNSTDVRIYLHAETEDGYVFEYDLFNGRTINEASQGSDDNDDSKSDNSNVSGFVYKENYFAGNYSVYDQKGAKYEKN